VFRRILSVVVLMAFALPAGADDALVPATVAAVKKASVYIRAEGDGWGATGSGFVVAADGKGLLIATNHHVAVPDPPPAAKSGKPVALSVVFDSGTKAEREYPATVVGADAERDLAVLWVVGVKDPPRPIPVAGAAPPTETMPVYTFGFPLGEALALNKGYPAITVGKASVSSLRNDADGDLAIIQKVSSRVRVYLRGSRVHIVQVLGPAEQVGGAEAEILLSAYRLSAVGAVAPPPGLPGPPPVVLPPAPRVAANLPGTNPAVVGGKDPFFKDAAPKGGLLVGVEVVPGEDHVLAVMPLYRVGKVDQFGTQFGTSADAPMTVKAKPGYAVGGITAKARAACDGFCLTFMRVVNGRLDPSDSYESEWVGSNGPAPATKYLSDGVPVVGLVGRANAKDVTGVGLLFQGQETAAAVAAVPGKVAPPAPSMTKPPTLPAATLPVGKEPTIFGGAFDPIFTDAAPDGGLLVGFEIGTAPAFGHIMTRAARPIYRAGGKETFGEQRGTQLRTVVTLKAKAGYAVGAISVMSGLGFDGLSVTFMKVAGGKLDPTDSYESAYVGSDQKKRLTKLGGDGTPVVGIVGKSNRADMTGMGLLFKGQEGYQPRR